MTKTILSIGRVDPEKRPGDAVQVVRIVRGAIPDVRFVWVGDGSLLQEFRSLQRNEPFLNFVGQVGSPRSRERWELMRSSDVFISTSQREGFCVPIGEALLAKLPVVAYDLPVYQSVFGDTIVRIPCFDLASFANAVVDVLVHPAKYRDLVEKGYRLVVNRYSKESVIKSIEEVFFSLTNKKCTMPSN